MKFDMTAPCPKCPFRSDIRPFLTKERAEEISRGLYPGQQTFPCHLTVEHGDDDEYVITSGEQHCAGAMIMLEAKNRPNQMMRIAERFGQYDRRKLVKNAPVFKSFAAFIAAQRKKVSA